jgi:diaminohydroxyphosphoribosylaminopyrimidine deaminase / 5-amino-6-(5-phosphoribosylamino)uracil reductase
MSFGIGSIHKPNLKHVGIFLPQYTELVSHETYMRRCLDLAALGQGKVAPNPMVGAVLVHNDSIIGEGYHMEYGKAHAEVNCIASVSQENQHLICESVLYVSLEPCAHFGKTPPCADLIIEKKIPHVVVGIRDPFVEVNGKGIEKLIAANIKVDVGVLEKECKDLNKRFFLFHTRHRPYVILKWSQSSDGKIAGINNLKRVFISNEYSNRIVHKWRSEEMSIMVGTNTALSDNPELTTRLWPGNDPLRLVVDMDLRLPQHLKLFNSKTSTIVFNLHKHSLPEKLNTSDLRKIGLQYYQVTADVNLVHQVMNALNQLKILSVFIEGGAQLLQSFIDEGTWDEARIITNEDLIIGEGLPAPVLNDHELKKSEQFHTDKIDIYTNREGTRY